MTKNTANKTERQEAYYLKLILCAYCKRVRELLSCIELLAEPYFKGMSVFEYGEPRADAIPHVSSKDYDRKRGINPKTLLSLLESERIIKRVLGSTYIGSPFAYPGLCFYKKIPMLADNVRCCLYCNADGVRFLDEFVSNHAFKTEREFIF